MTRKELITRWCAAEGGKKSALDAPQAREAWAKLRAIIGESTGIDIEEIVTGKNAIQYLTYNGYRFYDWQDGKPVKGARK